MITTSLYAKAFGAVLLLAALVGLYAYGYRHGEASVQSRWDAQQKVEAAALAAAQSKAATITERVVTQYVDRVKVIHDQAQTIIRKVPVYVSAKADASCTVPTGFVRLHDAAVQGVDLPATTGSTADAPSGVALSAVAGTVAGNYGICRETAERLSALQGWVRQQAGSKPDSP